MNNVMNEEWSRVAANAVCFSVSMVQENFRELIAEMQSPSVVYKPVLSRDGDKWVALYGEDLQVGVVGIGDSPALAMYDFNRAWGDRIKKDSTHAD
ncbi:MAG: hypothetical protein E6R04_06920 [Spirochaetes bacterium]|nr:MAG: hypothetical protein E6R04_06920 [Spirochaetota bacterium]